MTNNTKWRTERQHYADLEALITALRASQQQTQQAEANAEYFRSEADEQLEELKERKARIQRLEEEVEQWKRRTDRRSPEAAQDLFLSQRAEIEAADRQVARLVEELRQHGHRPALDAFLKDDDNDQS